MNFTKEINAFSGIREMYENYLYASEMHENLYAGSYNNA